MALSMTPILMYSEALPPNVREAFRAAAEAPAGEREASLASAARLLYSSTSLDCRDVRELVGLRTLENCHA